MKFIFKIEKYSPEENLIIVRTCDSRSKKSINEWKEVAVSLDDFDLHDSELFVDSLYRRLYQRLEKQDDKEEILQDNIGEKIKGELNLKELEGRVIKCGYSTSKFIKPLRVRKIEL